MNQDTIYPDYEEWEDDANLLEAKDYVALLELRRERAKRDQSDLHAQERYAEALILNKRYNEAIEFVTPLYRKHYEVSFGISQIIEGLIGLGKTEKDFDWIEPPEILRLDNNTIDAFINFLKEKRKFVNLSSIYENLLMQSDYLMFDEHELANYILKRNDIFLFKGKTNYFWDIKIKLKN